MVENVSIPYGKGKVWECYQLEEVIMYQFPMGKVKLTSIGRWAFVRCISYQFPMGKVKRSSRKPSRKPSEYQFPMGKVKNNILCCVYSIHQIYRFVNRIFVDFILEN